MKESKNNLILTKLKETDIKTLTEDELTKTAREIATNINSNGFKRHINYALHQITTDESIDNNKKLNIIKSLLEGQKLIDANVKKFKRKTMIATDKKDIITFITTTAETLTTINKYQAKKAKTEDVKEVKPVETTKANTKDVAKTTTVATAKKK